MEAQLTSNLFPSATNFNLLAIGTVSTEVSRDITIDNILQSVVPPVKLDRNDLNLPLMNAATRLCTSPLLRGLIYSIANNFVGLSGVPKDEVLTILKQVATLDLVFALAGVSRLYETRALARNLFILAMEVRDVETITYIVKKSHIIDLNEDLPIHGSNGKPIERAVAINDAHVVDTLIKLGASVNGTNALTILLEPCRGSYHRGLGGNPHRILDLLLSANPDVSERHMPIVVANFQSDVVSRMILERVDVTYQQWSEDPVLLQTFLRQPYLICYEVLRNLERHGADLNDGGMLKHLSCRFPDEGFLNLLRTFPQLQITDDILRSIVKNSTDIGAQKSPFQMR
ncbi:uncharacterized protein PG986_008489 [Apiospora aurea]|uniref:Uncharacterized protein n=1 Tax=Apiospora aurea TaxID=335848 RepID=A0ABR1QFK0_9PEZI